MDKDTFNAFRMTIDTGFDEKNEVNSVVTISYIDGGKVAKPVPAELIIAMSAVLGKVKATLDNNPSFVYNHSIDIENNNQLP